MGINEKYQMGHLKLAPYEFKTPWECPRCGRINSPFNPSCFCTKGDSHAPSQRCEGENEKGI